jgi:flagellar assembly protein FliH
MAVVRQLFRREIRLEPTHIIGVVRDAIRLLPIASRSVRLHLHPDDAALVRETLSPAEGEPAWTVVEDPLITRGGCRVNSENSRIDATAESRLQALISSVAGNERH